MPPLARPPADSPAAPASPDPDVGVPTLPTVPLPRGVRALLLALPVLGGLAWALHCLARWGEVAYPLDDTYIHLAVSQNLVDHGVWGIDATHFESASSSPLWTLLLALVLLCTPAVMADSAPLVLATVCAVWTMASLVRWSETCLPDRVSMRPLRAVLVLVLFVAGGTAAMFASGMDVALQVAVCAALLVAVHDSVRLGPTRRAVMSVAVLLALGSATRYENLALGLALALVPLTVTWSTTGAAGAWWRPTGLWLVSLALPVAAFAVFGTAHGQFALPTSVVAKAQDSGALFIDGVPLAVLQLRAAPAFALLLAMLVLGLLRTLRSNPPLAGLVAAVVISQVAQATLSRVGENNAAFYRYEAALLTCGLMLLWALPLGRGTRVLRAGTTLVALVVGVVNLQHLAPQTHEIQNQQATTAAFVASLPTDWAVVLNDLGLVALRGGHPVVDLMGLGDHEVAVRRTTEGLSPTWVDTLARRRNAPVAVLYPHWFRNQLPAWEEVTRWCLADPPLVVAGRCVSVYVTDPSRRDEVLAHVRAFESRHLPVDVAVEPSDS